MFYFQNYHKETYMKFFNSRVILYQVNPVRINTCRFYPLSQSNLCSYLNWKCFLEEAIEIYWAHPNTYTYPIVNMHKGSVVQSEWRS
jgi:hypothetical protein